jgi:hypothetical protein
MVEIVEEIAREEDLHFKLAVIHSEQDKQYLKRRFAEGRIKPLRPTPRLMSPSSSGVTTSWA